MIYLTAKTSTKITCCKLFSTHLILVLKVMFKHKAFGKGQLFRITLDVSFTWFFRVAKVVNSAESSTAAKCCSFLILYFDTK